jgi:hypothetical protein
MALHPCRECGRRVSTEAPSCPACGVPTPTAGPLRPQQAAPETRPSASDHDDSTGMQRYVFRVMVAVPILAVAIIVFSDVSADSEGVPPEKRSAAAEARDRFIRGEVRLADSAVRAVPLAAISSLEQDRLISIMNAFEHAPAQDSQSVAWHAAGQKEIERRHEITIAEAKRKHAEIRRAVSSRTDNIKNVTWFHANGSERWNQFGIYAYVGQQGDVGSRWMRLRMATRTDNWIFWEQIIFNVDGTPISIPVSRWDKDTDVGYGSVREWLDMPVDSDLRSTLRRIADGSDVKVRFAGKYKRDFTFGANDKQRLRTILDFFEQQIE